MLEAAAVLFHTKGYHATGLNELVSASEAPKGSLYFHFPGGKEQLAAEALRLSGDRLCEQITALVNQASGPADAIEALIELLATSLEESDFQRGCPLATAALDAADDSAEIRNACASGYRSWQELITNSLASHGVANERAERLGTVVLAGIEGALLLAKTQRDTAPLYAVVAHLRSTLEKETSA